MSPSKLYNISNTQKYMYVTRNVYHKQKLFYKSRFWLTYNLEEMSKPVIPVYIRLYTRDKLLNHVYKTAACTRC